MSPQTVQTLTTKLDMHLEAFKEHKDETRAKREESNRDIQGLYDLLRTHTAEEMKKYDKIMWILGAMIGIGMAVNFVGIDRMLQVIQG